MKTKMTQAEMHEAWKKRNEKKKNNPTPVLTPEKYEELKAANQSDNKIMADYGFYASKFHAWKKEHNLIGKHNLKTIQKEQGGAAENKSTTNQPKEQNAAQATVNTSKLEQRIEYLEKVNERQLADNQKLAAENTRLHKEMQEPVEVSAEELRGGNKYLQGEIETLKTELEKSKKDYKLERMATGGLERKLNEAARRIEELKRYERDYQALEVMHANMRARTHSIEEEVEETRAAMKILDSLYRGQSTLYLKSRDRLDELEVEE